MDVQRVQSPVPEVAVDHLERRLVVAAVDEHDTLTRLDGVDIAVGDSANGGVEVLAADEVDVPQELHRYLQTRKVGSGHPVTSRERSHENETARWSRVPEEPVDDHAHVARRPLGERAVGRRGLLG